jgi:F-type H+-transporting ATPase subunit b
MRHGWLLLGLGMVALALCAAPALADKVEGPAGEDKAHPDKGHDAGAKHDEHKSEDNIFKGFIDLSLWTIVVFLVLFFVLKKFAWGPMLQGLQERERSIHSAMEEAKAARDEAAKLRAELQAEIAKARAEGQALRDEARRDAERLREEINAKAKADIQAERDRLRREIETARDNVLKDLWAQAVQLSTLIASKAVRRQFTIEDQNRLVDEALAEFREAAGNRRNGEAGRA